MANSENESQADKVDELLLVLQNDPQIKELFRELTALVDKDKQDEHMTKLSLFMSTYFSRMLDLAFARK